MPIHADLAPWNVRFSGGHLTALLDFGSSRVDGRSVDVALARRGYHDCVVSGYLRQATLTDEELRLLDALWTAQVLMGLDRDDAARDAWYLGWSSEQLAKVRPFDG